MRSLNTEIKFAVIVRQKEIHPQIFRHKKTKQRYLDYAFKMGLKGCLLDLSSKGILNLAGVENIHINCDEHTTATDGIYELRESLLKEFKYGMFSSNYQKYNPPVIPELADLKLNYCASEKNGLIRAADIIANHVYTCFDRQILPSKPNLYLKQLP